MFRSVFFTICCVSILVFFQSCVPKSTNEAPGSDFLHPPEPYVSAAFMFTDVPVEALEHLMELLEEKINARTLTDYLSTEAKIDRQLGLLLGAVSLDAGIKKYGDPGFSDPQERSIRALYGFSRIRTRQALLTAIQVVKDTKALITVDGN